MQKIFDMRQHGRGPSCLRDSHQLRRRQRGAALLAALLMLIALLMLGIAAVRIGLQSEQISRNWRDRQIARQAAEAALLDAEYDIGNPNAPRHAVFDKLQTFLTKNGGGPGMTLPPGVHFPVAQSQPRSQPSPRPGSRPAALPPLWRDLGLAKGGPGVDYGSFTARFMQTGIGALPARPPRYLIEILPQPGSPSAADGSMRYRITVLGFGPDPNTRIMLQSVYRRRAVSAGADAAAAADPAAAPSMQLNWREIAATDAT
jgi:type IV pilus assembly protein PilX